MGEVTGLCSIVQAEHRPNKRYRLRLGRFVADTGNWSLTLDDSTSHQGRVRDPGIVDVITVQVYGLQ